MTDSVFPLIVETGIGVDLTGDDATKAALRAVEDTIRRTVIGPTGGWRPPSRCRGRSG
jgi:hypothetical protein